MYKINFYIQFPFNKYGGGGNQFLLALRKEFRKQGIYKEFPNKADVILFNSHHCFDEVFRIKKRFPLNIFLHRMDGPINLVRGKDRGIDRTIYDFNKIVADGTIFQSSWCKKQNKKNINISSKYETIIHNAADNIIFSRFSKTNLNVCKKIKLISTSNSSNWRKGFDVYKFLDENLNFSKYEMTFVGNSPMKFKNINWIKPVDSKKLAEILKQNDIYIAASQNDPCSNSLIEALSCGLPAVALNDGGHPELIQQGGELFRGKEDIIGKINIVAKNYSYYQSKIPDFSMKKVAREYYEFAQKIYNDMQKEEYTPKQVNFLTKISFYKMKLMILKWKVKNKLRYIKRKI